MLPSCHTERNRGIPLFSSVIPSAVEVSTSFIHTPMGFLHALALSRNDTLKKLARTPKTNRKHNNQHNHANTSNRIIKNSTKKKH